MLKFQDLQSGLSIYVDPIAIQAVAPAVAPPPTGVRLDQHIPRVLGSQLFIAGCAPLAVRGLPEANQADVANAKAAARMTAVTLN